MLYHNRKFKFELVKTLCFLLVIALYMKIITCCEMLQLSRSPAGNEGEILSNLFPTTRLSSTCRIPSALIMQSMKKVSKLPLNSETGVHLQLFILYHLTFCYFTFKVQLNKIGSVQLLPEYIQFPLASFVPCTFPPE
jgi:hypothetical protein